LSLSSSISNNKTRSRSHTTSSAAASAATRNGMQQQQQQNQQHHKFHPVYVHHVSRVALEHLQSPSQCDWLIEKGLHRHLNIHPNGTFTLTFPPQPSTLSSSSSPSPAAEAGSAAANAATGGGGNGSGKIWTSYDPKRKQHWLSVYRHKLAVRFLLKDHNHQGSLSSSSSATASVQYRNGIHQIRSAVDEMIKAVNHVDEEKRLNDLRRNNDRYRQHEAQQSHFLLKKLSAHPHGGAS
jgi:hypothetical protein